MPDVVDAQLRLQFLGRDEMLPSVMASDPKRLTVSRHSTMRPNQASESPRATPLGIRGQMRPERNKTRVSDGDVTM